MPTRAPRALTHARPCRNCRTTQHPAEYPLWEDPQAVLSGWATRHWCAACLVKHGHISAARAEQWRRRPEFVTARVQDQADTPRARVARHRTTVALVNRADEDPVFAAALLAAATQVRVAARPLSA